MQRLCLQRQPRSAVPRVKTSTYHLEGGHISTKQQLSLRSDFPSFCQRLFIRSESTGAAYNHGVGIAPGVDVREQQALMPFQKLSPPVSIHKHFLNESSTIYGTSAVIVCTFTSPPTPGCVWASWKQGPRQIHH